MVWEENLEPAGKYTRAIFRWLLYHPVLEGQPQCAQGRVNNVLSVKSYSLSLYISLDKSILFLTSRLSEDCWRHTGIGLDSINTDTDKFVVKIARMYLRVLETTFVCRFEGLQQLLRGMNIFIRVESQTVMDRYRAVIYGQIYWQLQSQLGFWLCTELIQNPISIPICLSLAPVWLQASITHS